MYMKIEIVSDIHLTHDEDHGVDYLTSLIPEEGTQVLVLAGDVGEFHWWQGAKQYLDIICNNYPHVLYVAGNHDYYGTTLPEGDKRFRELDNLIENFHFAEQEVFELDGKKFACCSLWFKEDPKSFLYEKWMNDFRVIQDFKPEVYERNEDSVEFLRYDIPQDTDVVVTHHMPSQLSVHRKYAGDPCNRFFLCSVDDVILDLQPKLWVHGHTHLPCNYYMGDTRVVCNPRGYPGERRDGPYKPVIVEI
jgi:predicted phosphodiesterase